MRAGDALAVFTHPASTSDRCAVERGVVFGFGGAHRLDLDLFRPTGTSTSRPAVVFVHGGGFRSGFPEMHTRQALELAERGYVTVSIDYRVFPEACWPGAVEDAKCAVRWLRAHRDALGVDPERIAVVGGSAGGYLAAMVALTPGELEGTGGWAEESSHVNAAILFYPLTDTAWPGLADDIRAVIADFLGTDDQETHQRASPSAHVSGGAPPILTLTGDRDREIPAPMVEEFHRRLDESGVTNRLLVLPGRAHAYDYSLDEWQGAFDLLSAFLIETLGAPPVDPAGSAR